MRSFNAGMIVMYVHGYVHGRHGGQLVRRGMNVFMELGARVYVDDVWASIRCAEAREEADVGHPVEAGAQGHEGS